MARNAPLQVGKGYGLALDQIAEAGFRHGLHISAFLSA